VRGGEHDSDVWVFPSRWASSFTAPSGWGKGSDGLEYPAFLEFLDCWMVFCQKTPPSLWKTFNNHLGINSKIWKYVAGRNGLLALKSKWSFVVGLLCNPYFVHNKLGYSCVHNYTWHRDSLALGLIDWFWNCIIRSAAIRLSPSGKESIWVVI